MGHVFHLAWYMNGVGFGDSSRTSVPKIMASYPPPVDCVEIVREHLQEGRRVTMKNVRVKTAKAQFYTTSSGMQLLITKSTTFEEVNGAQQCPPLHITDLGKLNVYENTKVNVASIITHIRPLVPMRAWGVKSRMCPPYPQRDRKRRLNGAVCRNHRIKRVVPCRC